MIIQYVHAIVILIFICMGLQLRERKLFVLRSAKPTIVLKDIVPNNMLGYQLA